MPQENVYTYAMTVCLYLDLARYLPNVAHVVHEEITPDDLRGAGPLAEHRPQRRARLVRTGSRAERTPAEGSEMAALTAAYDFLARAMRQGGRLAPSLAQNGGFLADGNKSELATIYYHLTQVMQANRRFTLSE